MSLFSGISEKLRSKKPASLTEEDVKKALARVIDPDLGKDIVALGFVKKIEIKGTKIAARVELTTPACPVKDLLKRQCEEAITSLPGICTAEVTMTAQTRGADNTSSSEALADVRNIVAVASGKGGVGKSTTAVSLAYSLSAQGAKVGILDADVYGPSIPQMTKVGNPEGHAGALIKPPEVDGVKIISVAMFGSAKQATILRGPMAAQIIKQFLTQIAWGELDYLIIDYPPGTGDIQLTLSQVAPITAAVIVTTPQEVALLDARKAVSMFETLKVPVLGVIETMSYFLCAGEAKKHYIFGKNGGEKLARESDIPLLGQIPIEEIVTETCDQGESLIKKEGQASQAYRDAAGQVAAQLSILHIQDDGALDRFQLSWQRQS